MTIHPAHPPRRRVGLKAAIVGKGWTSRSVAYVLGISENKLSAICAGWRDPSPDEREALRRILDCADDVFEVRA